MDLSLKHSLLHVPLLEKRSSSSSSKDRDVTEQSRLAYVRFNELKPPGSGVLVNRGALCRMVSYYKESFHTEQRLKTLQFSRPSSDLHFQVGTVDAHG